MSKPLDDNFIDELLRAPETKRRRYTKDEVSDPANRHVLVWVRLPHTLAYCTNEDCPDERPRKVAEGNAMCVKVGGSEEIPLMACRYCYLAGYGLPLTTA